MKWPLGKKADACKMKMDERDKRMRVRLGKEHSVRALEIYRSRIIRVEGGYDD